MNHSGKIFSILEGQQGGKVKLHFVHSIALVLFDTFKGQTTESVYKLLESNAI